MRSLIQRLFPALPEVVGGYEIAPGKGLFRIIIPQATINLVVNPSLEESTGGYGTSNAGVTPTLTRTALAARRGSMGLRMSFTGTGSTRLNIGTGVNLMVLTIGEVYSFSFDLKAQAGAQYTVGISDASAVDQFSTVITGIGAWKRYSVSGIISSVGGGSHYAYIARTGTAFPDYDLDGVQVEQGLVPTTYCDGDQDGCLWGGLPQTSVSYRSDNVRSGGVTEYLGDLGLRVLSVVGLGMPPADVISDPFALLDGSFYGRTRYQARPFTLVGALTEPSMRDITGRRSTLADLIQRNLATPDQPLTLLYQYDDGSPVYRLKCLYTGGLEGVMDNHFQERLGLQFFMPSPHIVSDFDNAVGLTVRQTFDNSPATNGYGMLRQMPNGSWAIMPGESNAFPSYTALEPISAGGALYASGNGGLSLYRIDLLNNTRVTVLTANGPIWALRFDPVRSRMYVGGAFTTLDGAAHNRIAWFNIYDPPGSVTINDLSTGIDNNIVLDIAVDIVGNVIAVGSFTAASGVANTARVAFFDGTNWSSLDGGAAVTVHSVTTRLEVSGRKMIVIGGEFTNLGSGTSSALCDYLAAYVSVADGGTGKWEPFTATPPGGFVYVVRTNTNNQLYVGGAFNTFDGVTMNFIAYNDGSSYTGWRTMGSGFAGTAVKSIFFTQDGLVMIGGQFSTANGASLQAPLVFWNGNRFLPIPLRFTDPANSIEIKPIAAYLGHRALVGWTLNSVDTVYTPGSVVVSLPEERANQPYPTIRLRGTVALTGNATTIYYLANEVTGGQMFFNALPIAYREIIDITFAPEGLSIWSSLHGDRLNYLLGGSTPEKMFLLSRADNLISVFTTLDSTSVEASMFYKDRLLALPRN